MWTAANIEAWAAEIKPLTLNKTPTIRLAAEYYQQYMMPAAVVCPIGNKVVLTLGHFFPLVCKSVPGTPSKGWVTQAESQQHAFELILQGLADVKDLRGCDYQRVDDLPLFFDTVINPHVIATKTGNKILYLKRYENKRPRIKVAVMVVYASDGGLRPASFHTHDLKAHWLNNNAPNILWQKNEG